MRGLLNEEKKIMFRYRGTGKFAVRKREKQREALVRNAYYQEQISTSAGIKEYITNSRFVTTKNIGAKQYAKLQSLLKKLTK